jgi:hypothetical protein
LLKRIILISCLLASPALADDPDWLTMREVLPACETGWRLDNGNVPEKLIPLQYTYRITPDGPVDAAIIVIDPAGGKSWTVRWNQGIVLDCFDIARQTCERGGVCA